MTLLLGLLYLLACDGAYVPQPPVDTDLLSAGCPAGTTSTRNASLGGVDLRLNSVRYFPAFDPTASYDGVPAACLSTDGRSGELRFTLADEPAGVIRFNVPEDGAYDLATDDGFLLEILVDSEVEGIVDQFGQSGWDGGTTDATEIGGDLVMNVRAARVGGAQQGYVQATWAITIGR